MQRPLYEALDGTGLPYIREARVIGELPLDQRRPALDEAAATLATQISLPVVKAAGVGVPMHLAFGMTRQQAKNHPRAKVLLTLGIEVSLDMCPSWSKLAA